MSGINGKKIGLNFETQLDRKNLEVPVLSFGISNDESDEGAVSFERCLFDSGGLSAKDLL